MPTRTFSFSDSNQVSYDSYDLELRDDGTFTLGCSSSDPAGSMGGDTKTGTWSQQGASIVLHATTQNSSALGEKTIDRRYAATVVGDELEVEGIGRFWVPR